MTKSVCPKGSRCTQKRAAVPERSPTALEIARRKARYGHRDWLVWAEPPGRSQARVLSYENLRAAMKDCGSQVRFNLVSASTAVCQVMTWRIGTILLRNLKNGYIEVDGRMGS